mgnify:CR=1 FL=1
MLIFQIADDMVYADYVVVLQARLRLAHPIIQQRRLVFPIVGTYRPSFCVWYKNRN